MLTSSSLGSALRSIRQERGLSLAAASALTGLSVATLSKIENGRRTLAYDKLLLLARALDVDIARLFSHGPAPVPPPMASGRRSVQSAGEGFVIAAGAYTCTYLAQDLSHKLMSPVILELHARSIEEFGALLSHEGEEHVLVLEGEAIVHTDIYEPLHLKQGDSVYLDGNAGHAYLNGGPGRARILRTASTRTGAGPEMPAAPSGTAEPGA